jgi:hypothetical protein
MSTIRDRVTLFVIDYLPRLAEFARLLRGNRARTFAGWGMTTDGLTPPWSPDPSEQNVGTDHGAANLGSSFRGTHEKLLAAVAAGSFNPSQFQNRRDKARVLNELRWRHFIVYWTAHYAASKSRGKPVNLAECGVCDGVTAYFACSAMEQARAAWHAYLYDAWSAMKAEALLPSESTLAGQYDYLEMETTRRNLCSFANHLTFNRGFIPDSFDTASNPDTVNWLHIDLNSAKATEAALGFFASRMKPGGVMLFDDYASIRYTDTKRLIDRGLAPLDGLLLPFPTAQAAFFLNQGQ